MSSHYSYSLTTLTAQGSNPKQPVFTNPFAYRPQVTIMEAYEGDSNSPIPAHSTLLAAKDHATKIRDKKVSYPVGMEERTYEGVDHDDMPKSRDLAADAEIMGAGDVATFFDDFLTAEFYRGALRPNKRMEDSTFPKSVAAMKLHVDLLVRAFKSTERCDDNRPMIQPFIDRRHDSKLVECLCWNIVKACIFRSKSDEPLLTAYEPCKARNSLGLDTFEKRFDAVALAMARSKTICKHLYDAPYINTFVDDPLRSIRRVDANRELNRQKAGIMAKGKALQQQVNAQNGVPNNKKTRASRKRRAATAELDNEDVGGQVHTPSTALTLSSSLTQSIPSNGRVTRRMSRLLAETQSSPFATPPSIHSHLAPSPLSSDTEIKDESSPLRHQQGYGMNGHNGVHAMGMHANRFDHTLIQGINFPQAVPRYPAPMSQSYPYGGVINHNPYAMNGMQLNFISANGSMPYRNGPMRPEEVTIADPNHYPISPFTTEDDVQDEEGDE